MKKVFLGVFICFIPIYFLVKIDPRFVFTGDGLNKLIQSKSLLENNFKSEEIFYPARDIDPDFNSYPFQGVYLIKQNDRHIGQYPIFFSFINALLLKILPYYFLPGNSYLFAIVSLFLLYKYWNVSLKFILFTAVCTNFLFYGIEFNENLLLVFLPFVAITILFHYESSKHKLSILFLSGCIMGSAVWLRLEALLFFVSLIGAWIFLKGFENKTLKVERLFFISGFTLVLFLFFLFNQWNYSHFLGPRYIANQGEFLSGTMSSKLTQAFTIAFAGHLKLGFFGYTPLFLLILVNPVLSIFKNFSEKIKILNCTIIFFIILVLLSAPNDGVVSWGSRYLALAILPSVIVLDEIFKHIQFQKNITKKLFSTITILLCVYSIFISLLGFTFTKNANRQLKEYQKEFTPYKNDYKIFSSTFMSTMIGTEYFYSIYLIPKDKDSLVDLISKIKLKKDKKRIIFFESIEANKEKLFQKKEESKKIYKNFLFFLFRFLTIDDSDKAHIENIDFKKESYLKILEKSFYKEKTMSGKYTNASIFLIQ
ncbi:MAG: glycosyltransferase family 39 protein [Leptospiraceae bacterium]|nr:hypothetical protein [Leptospiraceae bacterium]MCK6381195.1 glycosyltransferase family 39 protein [Leptospiraceae bacterium]NUM40449.1 hypothetical protein [Leptospiraceae bacterium]